MSSSLPLTLNLSEQIGGPKIAFVLFPDAASNEIRVQATQPTGAGLSFDFTMPLLDRSLVTLVYLSEAFGLISTAAQLLDSGMAIRAIAASLTASGVTVKII